MTETTETKVGSGNDAPLSPDIDLSKAPQPSRFKMRIELLDHGSKTNLLAETDNLRIQIRCYSPQGGENAMHAHHHQDHSFVVLQGQACYRFPGGGVMELGRNEGIMLPSGAYYCFQNSGAEPLVVMRITSLAKDEGDPEVRLGLHGKQIESTSAENNRPRKIVVREGEFFE